MKRPGPSLGSGAALTRLAVRALCLGALCLANPIRGETIRVGAYENLPKIYSLPDGRVSGFFPALLEYIARDQGWTLEYRKGTWQECLDRLERGEIDLMPDVALTPERQRKFDFAEETALISWAVIYTRPDVVVQSFLDLADRRIGLMKGSVYTSGSGSLPELLSKFDLRAEFVEYESYRDVFQALSRREADAGVVNNIFGSYFEKEYNVARSPVLFSPSQLRFAFPKDSPRGARLKAALDARLRALKADPQSFYYRAMDTHLYGAPHSETPAGAADWKSALTDEEKDWLRRHPVIHVGIDPEFYPFEFRGPRGEYQGIASDYVRLFNERLGLNLRVVEGLAWTAAVAGARSGAIDVLPCVGRTLEREQWLRFSRPYIRFQRVIMTRLDMPFLAGLKDIESLRVGVQGGSSHEGFLRENSPVEPVLFGSLEESLLALSGGKVDAVVANLASAAYWIRKLNLINLKAAAPASSDIYTLHFAVRKDWPELLGILNKALDLVSPAQEREIEQRWVAVEYRPGIERRVVWRISLRIAAAAAAVLLGILFWNLRLKTEIRRRKEIEGRLNYRERFERLVAETSSRLVAVKPAEMDRHIQVALAEIACFTGTAAGYLYAFDPQGRAVRTHAAGEPEALHAVDPGARDEEWLARLRAGRAVTVTAGADGEGHLVRPIRGRVVEVPCATEQQVTGFLGLVDPRPSSSAWSGEDISLLRLTGEMLSSALRRKQVEEDLQRYAVDLERANRQLQDLDQLKSLFIASVSHELRTPLNSIIGFTGVILKGMAGELNDKQRDQLQRVYHSAQHLLALITDIIDISKIEAGRVDVYPQAFRLDEVIREAVESIRPQAEAKSLRVECGPLPELEVFTDRKRLRQCLLNYLSNAVKYTEAGSVRVEARDLGERFEVAVSDTGIGISPEEQTKLFEPFVRLDSHLRIKAGGTGLGLYLTRKIARDILLGDIEVQSERNRGSTFILRAPRRLPAPPGEEKPS
ncbi:MAG: transporter substrate-binding domain-containing protein [Kiritimatiellae bacterium]|nr:transporter substrate-binding domain-containing protein [Kiritimatiellia bacterium]